MDRENKGALGKNSQEAKLRKQVRKSVIAVGVGVILLLLAVAAIFTWPKHRKDSLLLPWH